jgi:hypothetical protein
MKFAELKELIGQYGFPVLVTGYLLWERVNVMGQFTAAITANSAAIQELKVAIMQMGGGL